MGPPPLSPRSPRTAGIVVGVVVAVLALALLALMAVAFFVSRAVASRALSGDGGSGSVFSVGPNITWDADGPLSVVPVDVNGDGVEDVVGRYRVYEDPVMKVYVGAFDGNGFGRIWSAGPFGTAEQAVTSTRLAVAGDAVVVTDFRAEVHVLDLRSGKERSKLVITDRATDTCSPADGAAHVWIEVADRQNVAVDLAAGKLVPTPARPAWCGPKDAVYCEGAGPTGPCAASMGAMSGFTSAGIIPMQTMVAGSDGVALGLKTPGSPSSAALGFDPTTNAVRWRASVAPDPTLESGGSAGQVHGTLAQGRLYTWYSTAAAGGLHVAVLDARTGARQLDVALVHKAEPEVMGVIVPSATRIYVADWMWLDVLDAKSGAVIGTIGRWP
jgi:hypothetical protein